MTGDFALALRPFPTTKSGGPTGDADRLTSAVCDSEVGKDRGDGEEKAGSSGAWTTSLGVEGETIDRMERASCAPVSTRSRALDGGELRVGVGLMGGGAVDFRFLASG